MLSAAEERYVKPYYRAMMRGNALRHPEVVSAVAGVARDVASDEVVGLLRGEWRPRVMGAWLAAAQTSGDVTAAVLRALETSWGTLDSPPLAAAAVLLAGPAALPALETYAAREAEHRFGGADLVAAAAGYLAARYGVESVLPVPEPGERALFAALLAIAGKIREPEGGAGAR